MSDAGKGIRVKNQKAFQRDQLIYEFGILVQPFEDLARADKPPIISDYRVAIAKVDAGDSQWRPQVKQFTTFANDIVFKGEYQDISHVPERLRGRINELVNNLELQKNLDEIHSRFKEELANAKKAFHEFINRVPFSWEPVVFEANTPFTSYLRIKESIAVVNQRIHYFDRYLKADFFHLFLRSVKETVSVRLVTTAGTADYGVKSVTPISNLVRQQFSDYQLIEVNPKVLHDRNLRVDDQIFSLGPGVDRAGMALTNFGPSDSSVDAQNEFDRILASGRIIHSS